MACDQGRNNLLIYKAIINTKEDIYFRAFEFVVFTHWRSQKVLEVGYEA
ncbi:hypothetical protein Xenpb_01944 [Xenorhabdus sp. PB62.4]|nr:hypothetical protein [Xenorhabdus sp. PB62.4]